jgi:penicillin amidase
MNIWGKLSVLIVGIAVVVALYGAKNSVLFIAGKVLYGISWWQLPVVDGTVLLKQNGLIQNDVKIVRDNQGIAHIFGEQTLDVITAQGFAHAQERLWQVKNK